jgi:hypothetical protein
VFTGVLIRKCLPSPPQGQIWRTGENLEKREKIREKTNSIRGKYTQEDKNNSKKVVEEENSDML